MRVKADKVAKEPEASTTAGREMRNATPSSAVGPVRRSLQVGSVDDPYEREADRVANEVVARLRSGSQRSDEAMQVRRSTRLQAPVSRGPSPAISIGHQNGPPTIRRLPYEATYSLSDAKSILMASEGRSSPVTHKPGHPIQHVGRRDKAERFARKENKTKSVFASQEELFKAAQQILADTKAQTELRAAEAAPNTPKRIALKDVSIGEVKTWVARISKKRGDDPVTSSEGTTNRAAMMIDTMGNGSEKGIHIQTVYPEASD